MTPNEALTNLDNAVARYMGTRSDHVALQQSVQVIREALAALDKYQSPEAAKPTG